MKERLVGAAVLVALGVWLIPWVLDGPGPSRGGEPEALQLPAAAESSPLRSQTITLDDEREPPTPSVEPSPFASDYKPESTAETAPESTVESTPEPDIEIVPPVAAVTPEPIVETTSVPPPETSEVSDRAASGWHVQVGSYAEAENARRQADRVSSFGFDARVSAFAAGGRTMQRVRIGPQVSRERAEAVVSALSAHGFVAQLVFEE